MATSVFVQHPIPSVYLQKSSHKVYQQNEILYVLGKRYSGYLYELYPHSKDTFFVESYVNGQQDGIQKKWFRNKQLMEIRYYNGGRKNGKQIGYWENGNKRFEFTAADDVYEGTLKEWSMDAKLIHLGTYVNGQEEGPQKLWYDNGKIRANYIIKKGKRYGLLGTKNCKNVSDSIFIVL